MTATITTTALYSHTVMHTQLLSGNITQTKFYPITLFPNNQKMGQNFTWRANNIHKRMIFNPDCYSIPPIYKKIQNIWNGNCSQKLILINDTVSICLYKNISCVGPLL